jgi:hypothetical protein
MVDDAGHVFLELLDHAFFLDIGLVLQLLFQELTLLLNGLNGFFD